MLRRVMMAGSGWSPLALSPSFLLDDESRIIADDGFVTSWGDRSGNGAGFSATSSARPALVASGLNGRRIVSFDGSDDRLLSSAASAMSWTRASFCSWGCFVVKKRTADATGVSRILVRSNGGGSGGVERLALRLGNSGIANRPQVGTRRLDTDTYATMAAADPIGTAWRIIFMQMDWASGSGVIRIDGAQAAFNGSLTTAGATSDTNPSQPIAIGGHPNASGSFIDADVACVIAGRSSGALASIDIEQMEGWCARKWGLSGSLPVGHPYK